MPPILSNKFYTRPLAPQCDPAGTPGPLRLQLLQCRPANFELQKVFYTMMSGPLGLLIRRRF